MKLQMVTFVAIGGAIGAVARYALTNAVTHWVGHGVPWGTITVNILGSFLLGALLETMALVWSPPEAIRAMLVIGVLGAFTTFSTFSLDIQTLIMRGSYVSAGMYIAGSVIIGVGAFIAGMAIFRQVWA